MQSKFTWFCRLLRVSKSFSPSVSFKNTTRVSNIRKQIRTEGAKVINKRMAGFRLFVFYLFDLILYVPVNNFIVISGRVFLCCTSTKQGLLCLAQGHKAVMLVRLKSATP